MLDLVTLRFSTAKGGEEGAILTSNSVFETIQAHFYIKACL